MLEQITFSYHSLLSGISGEPGGGQNSGKKRGGSREWGRVGKVRGTTAKEIGMGRQPAL